MSWISVHFLFLPLIFLGMATVVKAELTILRPGDLSHCLAYDTRTALYDWGSSSAINFHCQWLSSARLRFRDGRLPRMDIRYSVIWSIPNGTFEGKEKIVNAWTNKILHYKTTVTSLIEGFQGGLKRWIPNSAGDLKNVIDRFVLVLQDRNIEHR